MPVRRTLNKRLKSNISDDIRAYLETGAMPDQPDWDFYEMTDPVNLKSLWESTRDEILSTWIKSYPGSRPWIWWKLESPEPRRRIGGVGTEAASVLAYKPAYDFGIANLWVDGWLIDYYRNRGTPIEAQAIDPVNPPIFESQAVYLRRLNILTPAEKSVLSKKRKVWEPETIEAC